MYVVEVTYKESLGIASRVPWGAFESFSEAGRCVTALAGREDVLQAIIGPADREPMSPKDFAAMLRSARGEADA
jgi:hypothetical protein